MNWLKQFFSRRRRLYNDLSDEMQQHLDEKIEELIAGGLSRRDAAYAARRSGYCRCTSLKIKGLHAAPAVRLQSSTPQGSLGLRSFCQEIRDEFAGGLRIFFHDPMTGVGNDAAGHVAGDKRQDIHHALA